MSQYLNVVSAINESVCEELERRFDECDGYLELVESKKESLATAISQAVNDAVENAIKERLEKGKVYLELIRAARASFEHALPPAALDELSRRLEATEEWSVMDPVDHARLCAIILPERCYEGFQRLSARQLSQWGRFCREVFPEGFAERTKQPRPTQELAGSWAKVAVMTERENNNEAIYSRLDNELAESEALLAPQALGNGKKDARTIDGKAVEKLLVRLQGKEPEEETAEKEWGEGWQQMYGRRHWYRVELAADANLSAAEEVLKRFGWDARATRDGENGEMEFLGEAKAAEELRTLLQVYGVNASVSRCDGSDASVAEVATAGVEETPTIEVPGAVDVSEEEAQTHPRRRKREEADSNWLPFDGFMGD